MNILRSSVPDAPPADIIEYARANLKVDGHSFDPDRTPQLVEPLRAMLLPETRIGTYVKPVQGGGGSTAGEILCAFWAAFCHGLIQFNWPDIKAAEKRWKERILACLKSCRDLKRTGARFEETLCEAHYPNST